MRRLHERSRIAVALPAPLTRAVELIWLVLALALILLAVLHG